MVKKNLARWAPEDICVFMASASKNRTTGLWTLSGKSVLEHSQSCPVASAKVKPSMLAKDPAWRASIGAHGGKAKAKVIRAEAAKIGLGGSAATNDALYQAQKKVRGELNLLWEAQWAEFGRYFHKLKEAGIKAVYDTNDDGVFLRAFVAFPAGFEAITVNGRGVCSTDFGHIKHEYFGGLNATGLFQLGDGTVIPLWSAIFAESEGAESQFMWEYCAEQIKNAGFENLYKGAVHFRDRHRGADGFERILSIEKGMCVNTYVFCIACGY